MPFKNLPVPAAARPLLALLFSSLALAAATPDRSGVKPQVLSLPSGPGSLEGLGESFEPQLNTGTFTYRIPLRLPPVRGGAPDLALTYNSGSGNGPLGLGWQLSLPQLQRQTDKGLPAYSDTDTVIDDSGEELVRLADGSFRQENESAFTRFSRTPAGGWRAQLRNGTIRTFGESPASRLDWPTHGTFRWHLESVEDPNGNRAEYNYLSDRQQLYPREIRYGLHAAEPSASFRVVFDYDTNRTDAVIDYRPRFRSETRLRLKGITVFLDARRLRHWRLTYHTNTPVSLLASVTCFGDDRARLDDRAEPNVDFLPPTTFGYTQTAPGQGWELSRIPLPDPVSFADGRAELADLNADGLPDLLFERNSVLRALVNPGGTHPWPASRPVANSPTAAGAALGQPTTRLADVRGDGRSKLLVLHQRASLGGRSTFRFQDFLRPDELGPSRDFLVPDTLFPDDPRVRLVDLDNDRATDLLRIDEGSFPRVSLLLSTPSGGYTNALLSGSVPGSDISFALGWQLADLNGDRLQDLVLLGGNDNTWVCFNSGFGRFESRSRLPGGPAPEVLQEGAGAQLVDLDQDGLADLVIVDHRRVRFWPNLGGQRWGRRAVLSDPGLPAYQGDSTTVRFADFNANGSTDILWSEPNSGFLQVLDLNPAGKAWLLADVHTTLGRSLAVGYRSHVEDQVAAQGTPHAWTSVAPFAVPVVARLVEGDGLGHSYTNTFTYRNAWYDALEREFRGFQEATRRELGDDAQGAPTLITRFRYDTGAATEALKGKPLEIATLDDAGDVFWRQTNAWSARVLPTTPAPGEPRVNTFAFQRDQSTDIVERLAPDQTVRLRQTFDYDDFGNETRHEDFGRLDPGDPPWDDERITVRTFSAAHPSGQARWLLDRVVTEELRDPAGAVLTRRHSFYDDPGFAGDNPGGVVRGNLTLVREWISPGSTNAAEASRTRLAVRQRHDPFGNVVESLDPLGIPDRPESGHQRAIAFDRVLHTHVVTETIFTANPIALAADDAAPRLAMHAAYDHGLGVLTNALDFNSQPTRFKYDPFGRLTAITRPGDTPESPTSTFTYRLADPLPGEQSINWTETRQRETAGAPGTFDSRTYSDGLGRTVMARTESERPGEVVVSGATTFNPRRSIRLSLLPYFEPGSLAYQPPNLAGPATETRYDALGRVQEVHQPSTHPSGRRAFARTTYTPLARTQEDEEQTRPDSPRAEAALRYVEDGFRDRDGKGRLRVVEEIVKLDDEGRPTTQPATWTTRYRYDRLGNFTGYTDSQNNEKEFRYDALSRRTFLDDPDRGTMSWHYDDAGNLLESRDARGQVIRSTYDGANRLLTEDLLDEAQPAISAGHAYDPRRPLSPTNRADVVVFHDLPFPAVDLGNLTSATARLTLGRPAAVWDLTGEEHSSYDARGRVEWTVKRIRDPVHGRWVSFRTGFDYDSLDRLTRLTYPDDDFVFHEYNARNLPRRFHGGHVVAALGTSNVVTRLDYLASGQPAAIEYGNGVRTDYDHDARLRLRQLATRHPASGVELLHFAYAFDDASNLERIEDRRPLSAVPAGEPRRNTQHFRYDDLYRLTEARYGFGSPDDLARDDGHIAYRYDRIGNMLEQTSTLEQLDHGIPVANVGEMRSGGSAGRFNRHGRAPTDPPGPHALSSITKPGATTAERAFPYDANGNMTDIDGLACTWDFKDRLVRVENAEWVADYAYDYTDRRVSKRVQRKALPNAGPSGSPASAGVTLYIDPYSEVRPGNSFTKYVWNGPTRIARLTTHLSPGPRIQRIRYARGWNLLAPAVAPARLSANPDFLLAARWNPAGANWLPVSPGDWLAADSVLWLQTAAAGTVAFSGEPMPTRPRTVTGPVFIPLQATSLAGTDFEIWIWDSAAQSWRTRSPGLPGTVDELPALPDAGQAFFLRTDSATALSAPGTESTVRFYHQDHLGSTSVVTDGAGRELEETAFFAFGAARDIGRASGLSESYGFTQKEQDDESGLGYFEARYLGSSGRFLSVDPAGATVPSARTAQGLSPYAYALNRPLVVGDDTGRVAIWIVGGVIGGIASGSIELVIQMRSGKRLDWGNVGLEFGKGAIEGASLGRGKALVQSLKFGIDVGKGLRSGKSLGESLTDASVGLAATFASKATGAPGAAKEWATSKMFQSFDEQLMREGMRQTHDKAVKEMFKAPLAAAIDPYVPRKSLDFSEGTEFTGTPGHGGIGQSRVTGEMTIYPAGTPVEP